MQSKGAATTVWAATAKEWEGKGGRVSWKNCSEALPRDHAKNLSKDMSLTLTTPMQRSGCGRSHARW